MVGRLHEGERFFDRRHQDRLAAALSLCGSFPGPHSKTTGTHRGSAFLRDDCNVIADCERGLRAGFAFPVYDTTLAP
jgi:hypothetical protein